MTWRDDLISQFDQGNKQVVLRMFDDLNADRVQVREARDAYLHQITAFATGRDAKPATTTGKPPATATGNGIPIDDPLSGLARACRALAEAAKGWRPV